MNAPSIVDLDENTLGRILTCLKMKDSLKQAFLSCKTFHAHIGKLHSLVIKTKDQLLLLERWRLERVELSDIELELSSMVLLGCAPIKHLTLRGMSFDSIAIHGLKVLNLISCSDFRINLDGIERLRIQDCDDGEFIGDPESIESLSIEREGSSDLLLFKFPHLRHFDYRKSRVACDVFCHFLQSHIKTLRHLGLGTESIRTHFYGLLTSGILPKLRTFKICADFDPSINIDTCCALLQQMPKAQILSDPTVVQVEAENSTAPSDDDRSDISDD